jgi:hypothetical protein
MLPSLIRTVKSWRMQPLQHFNRQHGMLMMSCCEKES